MEQCKLLIVGAGVAGMSAAISAWDAGCRDILLVDRAESLGGVLPQCIHEGFGLSAFGVELTGPEYAARIAERLGQCAVRILLGTEVLSVTKGKTAVLSGREGLRSLSFERMILAAGCRERTIGALPIAGTRPSGIFTAGQAQELVNLRHQVLGNRILILGSGDLGVLMARRFTLEGKHVVAVIEQEGTYSAMARNYRRCIERYHIPLIYRATITEILGTARIRGVTLKHLDSGLQETVPCDTLITAVGLLPERELVRELGQPSWLWLCGNCNRIHEIADSAAAEAENIGRRAATW